MAWWTPATSTAWRFGRLRTAASWHVHLLVSWWAQALVMTVPPPAHGLLSLFGAGSHAAKRGTQTPVAQPGRSSPPQPGFWGLRCVLVRAAWDR